MSRPHCFPITPSAVISLALLVRELIPITVKAVCCATLEVMTLSPAPVLTNSNASANSANIEF